MGQRPTFAAPVIPPFVPRQRASSISLGQSNQGGGGGPSAFVPPPRSFETVSAYPTLKGRNVITFARFSKPYGSSLIEAVSSTFVQPWVLTLKCGETVLINFVNVIDANLDVTSGRPLYVFRDVCNLEQDEANEVTIQEEGLIEGTKFVGYTITLYHKVGGRGDLASAKVKLQFSFNAIMASDVKDGLEQNLITFRDRGKSQCVLMGGKIRRSIKK